MFSQGYLIDTQLCIIVLWLFYVATLHRRIPLPAARIYLLTLFPVSLLLPLLRIPVLPAPEISATPITETLSATGIPATFEPVAQTGWIYAIPLLTYLLGVIIVSIVNTMSIIRIRRKLKNTRPGDILFSPEVAGAYSVFGRIFVNDKFQGSPLLDRILAHEQSHIAHRHSADLIWMNLWRSLLWFNPLAWHCGKLIREVHEFQADRDVIRQGNAIGPYLDLLIGTEAGIYPGTANALCYSLTKKRIKMMTQTKSGSKTGNYLRLAALPLVGVALLSAFSLTAKASDPAPHQPQPVQVTPADTLRDITVSVTPIVNSIDLDVKPISNLYADGKKINRIDLDVKTDTTAAKPSGVNISVRADSLAKPIYVIDGVIIEGKADVLKSINPDDITSIIVLEGAASTAKYGVRARDGAIVVTTKKPARTKTDTTRKQ